ncbi:MAG: hypothetical protein WCT01_00455 [Candidatus Shapirobacteria bacterium]
MSDYSIRFPTTKERLEKIEVITESKKLLPKITDLMYKPKGKGLDEYDPKLICMRLRVFEDQSATLVELRVIKKDVGYTDERTDYGKGTKEELEVKLEDMGYEFWGGMETTSWEYIIEVNREKVMVLYQENKPVGNLIKIEAPSYESLVKIMEILEITDEEKIERNMVALLAEKLEMT